MEHAVRELPQLPAWLAGVLTPEMWSIAFLVVQSLIIFLAVVIFAALMIPYERRMLALWQDRYDSNRVGWQGSLQVAADMLKIFFKEDWTPKFADKFIFVLQFPCDCLVHCLSRLYYCTDFTLIGWGRLEHWYLILLCDFMGLAVYAVMFGGWPQRINGALLGG